MMELKDFVSTTIKPVAEGVNEAIKANGDNGPTSSRISQSTNVKDDNESINI